MLLKNICTEMTSMIKKANSLLRTTIDVGEHKESMFVIVRDMFALIYQRFPEKSYVD